MGQVQDHQNSDRGHARVRSQGQKVRRNLTALGCATLALSFGSLGLAQVGKPVKDGGAVLTAPTSVTDPIFDQEAAWKHLLAQVAFGPRNPGSAGHVKCRDWLVKELKKQLPDTALQPFEHTWSRTGEKVKMWNIVGSQNWDKAAKRVLLVAHWDTRPTADMETGSIKQGQPILGANDGASGVAILLELARVLRDLPPGTGVKFLLVDGEDLGPSLSEMFLGAKAFAKAPGSPKPDYGILLDMVGDKDLRIPKEPFSMQSAPKLMNDLYAHAKKMGLGATFPDEEQGEIYDDHLPLQQAGIPTIDLIDFTYDPWHTLQDTADKCSAESLGKVGSLIESWLRNGG
ncbi:M28 family peptidase [bacterium]|nr:MAG: M28 family peptidase [bacterium]